VVLKGKLERKKVCWGCLKKSLAKVENPDNLNLETKELSQTRGSDPEKGTHPKRKPRRKEKFFKRQKKEAKLCEQ